MSPIRTINSGPKGIIPLVTFLDDLFLGFAINSSSPTIGASSPTIGASSPTIGFSNSSTISRGPPSGSSSSAFPFSSSSCKITTSFNNFLGFFFFSSGRIGAFETSGLLSLASSGNFLMTADSFFCLIFSKISLALLPSSFSAVINGFVFVPTISSAGSAKITFTPGLG